MENRVSYRNLIAHFGSIAIAEKLIRNRDSWRIDRREAQMVKHA